MRTYFIVAALVASFSSSSLFAQTTPSDSTESVSIKQKFWIDSRRGWHFYEDPEVFDPPKAPIKETLTPQTPPAPPVKAPESKRPEIVEFEALQKRLEESRNVAIVRPTEENVKRYLELEAFVVKQASYFSDVAQRVAWANPDLDVTSQGRPTNVKALQVYEDERRTTRSESLAALGQSHVLMFFFRSDCKYCHAFAPIVQAFSRKHGIKVMPISLDGGPIPGFAEFKVDNGISKTLGVQSVPATFVAEPFTGNITTIGFGVMSESELVERITTVTAPGASTLTPSVTRKVALQ